MKPFELGQESYWDCSIENSYLSYTDEWNSFRRGFEYAEREANKELEKRLVKWALSVDL